MLTVVLALAPIFLLILMGQAMKRWRFVPDAFWAPAEKLTYYVTFPALLTANLASADLAGVAWGPLAAVVAGATVAAGVLAYAARPVLGTDEPGFTSVFQGAIRPNTYVGLAGAAALFGAEGVTLTAICIAAVVPLVNVLAVAVLARHVPQGASGSGQNAPSVAATLKAIGRNPLIIACALGIALNAVGMGLPPVIGPLLDILASAALPIGLLAVGAGLALGELRSAGRPVVLASAVKLVGLPALAAAGAIALGLGGIIPGVLVLYAGLPCSASSYVLARQMGGDAGMMANIITVQTLGAMASLPLMLLPFV